MAKGQQKSNKEAKKPKKDTSPPKPISSGAVMPTVTTVVPDHSKKTKYEGAAIRRGKASKPSRHAHSGLSAWFFCVRSAPRLAGWDTAPALHWRPGQALLRPA